MNGKGRQTERRGFGYRKRISSASFTFLSGIMSGNSMDCTHQIAGRLAREGMTVVAVDLACHPVGNILKEQTILAGISTWSEGTPPADAVESMDLLSSLDPVDLQCLQFLVFAWGDSNFEHFCKCGHDLDTLMERLGARRISPRVDADVNFDEEFPA